MNSMDDLPPIPPENRFFFHKALTELLFPPKGKVIYSKKVARMLKDRIIANLKKDPATVRAIARSIRGTPLDEMVAQELRIYRGVAK